MDDFINYLSTLGLDFWNLLKTAGVLILGILLIALIARFIFGKKSNLNHAVSSAIGIIFVYGTIVGLKHAGPDFEAFLAPLPFVTLAGDQMVLFLIEEAAFEVLCAEILSMVILAFLVNLAERWLPTGKNILSWVFFRFLTVVLGLLMHLIVTGLFSHFMPEAVQHYAPMILLGVLVIMLLTGALKIVVGLLVSTVNPLIAGLYTFFFASLVGKQITRSVMTTGILMLLVYGLQAIGVYSLNIAATALVAYIPVLVLLVLIWYLVSKVLNR